MADRPILFSAPMVRAEDCGGKATRSSRAEVRNPVLALPGIAALRDLPPEARTALRGVLLAIRDDSRERAEKCWRTRKAPMAAYWKAVSVYAGHIAKAIGRNIDAVRADV